ncbi:MAG: FHA domain-containing protein [Verrucomicrobia bacterium]|nr:FHA domain-containing protein [Verrucomicrobiota bacterium]MDA1087284.1 FHA domain-containing protein [Verrucomicrobiota bacterium]
MSAVLVISKDQKQINKVTIDKAQYIIGRSQQADLTLDDSSVSRQHTEIVLSRGIYRVKDRQSRNGTLVNDETITGPHDLSDGDVIKLGDFELRFLQDDAPPSLADAGEDDDDDDGETQFMASDEILGKAKKPKRAQVKKTAGEKHVKIVALDGVIKGVEFQDWPGDLTFGRSPTCDIVIPEDSVSTAHARITRRGDDYVLVDLESANGTFMNGQRAREEILSKSAKLRIGTVNFQYTETDPVRQKKVRMITIGSVVAVLVLLAVVKILQPEDFAEKHTQLGLMAMKKRDYQVAISAFDAALKVDAEHIGARKGLKQAKLEVRTEDFLAKAYSLAEEQKYDEALNACYDILRERPKHKKASILRDILKGITEARLAIDARNWGDGIALLEQVPIEYRESAIVSTLLTRAKDELVAMGKIEEAKGYVEHSQWETANDILATIPEWSSYTAEAHGLRDQIGARVAIGGAIKAANDAYRSGDLSAASAHVATGLRQNSAHKELLELKSRIDRLEPFVTRLKNVAALYTSDDVAEIHLALRTSRTILDLEKDPRNEIRLNAKQAEQKLLARLDTIASRALADGKKKMAGGDPKGAVLAFRLVLKADPSNGEAKQMEGRLMEKIQDACRTHFGKGKIHEELGNQNLAIQEYQAVLDTALPGSDYFERAAAKLKRLKQ